MTTKRIPNGDRNVAADPSHKVAPRPLRTLVMQEMYGPCADSALDELKVLWINRYSLKLDIEHTSELPPYVAPHRRNNHDWDLIVWQRRARATAAGPGQTHTDTTRLDSRTEWLTEWAKEKIDRLVVIDENEAFEKLRTKVSPQGGMNAGNIVAGQEELPARWLTTQRNRGKDAVWIVCDINGAVDANPGWFDTRNECQAHIRAHLDSAETREYGLDSMYEPTRVELERTIQNTGRIWVRVKREYDELDQSEKGYPTREACAAADVGDGLTPKAIERNQT